MNANEVIAALAGDRRPRQRPRQHGPVVERRLPQRRAPRRARRGDEHAAARAQAARALADAQGQEVRATSSRPAARTSWTRCRSRSARSSPATPRRSASARSASRPRSSHVRQIPLGGTATGTGLNTHPKFADKRAQADAKETKLKIEAPADPFEAQGNRDALVELSGALKVVAVSLTKIAQDLALMGSGPRAGIGELYLPELQKGSSIMPGKVNPVIPEVVLQVAAQVIGNDAADHRRRPAGPVRAQRPRAAAGAQPAAVDPPAVDRVGRVRREVRRRHRGQQGGHRSARPRRRSPWPPRSTSTSATTRRRRSSRRRPTAGACCATSRSRRASTPSCTTRSSTCGGSPPAARPTRRTAASRRAPGAPARGRATAAAPPPRSALLGVEPAHRRRPPASARPP